MSTRAKRKLRHTIKSFLLKEDTTEDQSSSEDIQSNFLLDNLDDSDEEILIFHDKRDPKTKKKVVDKKKSYKMTVVDERVGYKIRLDDQFYSQNA